MLILAKIKVHSSKAQIFFVVYNNLIKCLFQRLMDSQAVLGSLEGTRGQNYPYQSLVKLLYVHLKNQVPWVMLVVYTSPYGTLRNALWNSY